MKLETKTKPGFFGESCFATTKEKHKTTKKDWYKLHEKCVDMTGYKGRMAFIKSRAQIEALVKQGVVEVLF
jgi:hypothetical protein